MEQYDFSGWATKNNLKCSDGRTILRDAFADCDGKTVPLVWNHQHSDPIDVLGHALLQNKPEGVYAYCSFNNSELGQHAKELVKHGDVTGLSIYANKLRERNGNVMHGVIREVSIVLAGANPGALIENVMAHSDDEDDDDPFPSAAVITTGEEISLYHSDEKAEEPKKEEEEKKPEGKKKTVGEVFNEMTEEQKAVVYALVGEALGDSDDDKDKEGEDDKMAKHNVFDNDTNEAFLSHADEEQIIKMAKTNTIGSFKAAMDYFMEQSGALQHGFDTQSLNLLFPEYKNVPTDGAPEKLTTDQGWITKVLNKVHKSPISRIRTRQADLRDISNLRAKGYEKGTEKTYTGNISLLHRTTDPQTVYVKSKLDRDDIIDITDFDVVNYMYQIDRANLNEELATAIMLGDGREDGADGKIDPVHIRPIWTDDELYTIHADVDIDAMSASLQGTNTAANFGENYIYAEAIIQTLLYARENYKGSSNPDFFCTPHLVNIMLLARDLNGRRIYDNVNELKAALNVNEIITAEQFANKVRTDSQSHRHTLLGIMCNLSDYYLGSTKGGEITHFTDFDIDFNQEKSLLETRCSGANTRVKSAIVLEMPANP